METELNETPGRAGDHEPMPVPTETLYCEWLNRRVDISEAREYYNSNSSHCRGCHGCQEKSTR